MMDRQRLAYLQALDIPVWLPRSGEQPATAITEIQRLKLGPGSGNTLMICEQPGQSSTPIASDIARTLAGNPVWAWPDDSNSGPTVAEAVDESLFIGVIVFGPLLASQLWIKEAPASQGPARVLVADDLETLRRSAGARRNLWRQLCNEGMVKSL